MPRHEWARRALAMVVVATTMTVAATVAAGGGLPAPLVGEWVSVGSDFEAGALTRGIVVYLRADGIGTLIASPPLLGVTGHATWDDDASTLTLHVTRPGRRITTCPLVWDPAAGTLTDESGRCAPEPLIRGRDHVPDYVLEAFEALGLARPR